MTLERFARHLCGLAAAVLLAACGGGGDSASCDVASQKTWLRSYMLDWYYWSGLSPNPDPAGYASVADYFQALKYTSYPGIGVEPWSYIQDSVSYNRFFAEGRAMDYGLSVNGREGVLPLKIRYVEPRSPAAAAGLLRGDVIKAIDGVADSTLISSDFAVLSPHRPASRSRWTSSVPACRSASHWRRPNTR